jgi:hypothetical protein
MNHHYGRSRFSPLIAPAVSSLIILAPSKQDLSTLSRQIRKNTCHNLLTLASAANIVDVPLFVYSPESRPGQHRLANQLASLPRADFVAGPHAIPWQNATFRDAVASQDRCLLLLTGFWLEHQIVATTLHALADTYEVYIVLDATPARSQGAARLSQDRLIQAGATPVTTSQVVHEWALESLDISKRAALNALLRSRSKANR